MATFISRMKSSVTRSTIATIAVLACASVQACGDCAGVGLSRLSPTEKTIQVGESFVATYELGGSCSNGFAPSKTGVRWSSAEVAIVAVDSLTGQVTGKHYGDALVVPNQGVTTGAQSILVHVR